MFSMETYQQQNESPFITRSKKLFIIIFFSTYVPFHAHAVIGAGSSVWIFWTLQNVTTLPRVVGLAVAATLNAVAMDTLGCAADLCA